MNFLDAYDITDPTVAAAASNQDAPEPTLTEEVNQVVGQFSRFWGGFRKQVSAVSISTRLSNELRVIWAPSESISFRDSQEGSRSSGIAGAEGNN